MDIIKAVEATQLKDNPENFNVGDTVKVFYRIVEGTTERVQVYEGLVIAKNNAGLRRTFTVRKISFNVGVERVFFFIVSKPMLCMGFCFIILL